MEPVGSQQSARAPASIELGVNAAGKLDLAVLVVDLSTPATPVLIGGFKTNTPARDVAASSTTIFVATGTDEEGEVLVLATGR